ncbi:MAG: squalene synthase HpnC [Phycisphaeraceae bacterium]|nr:squalene synthase HpnC [Phycisphaeraceae bacterium]
MSSILDQLDRYGPDRCERLSVEQAGAYVRELARTHYENFTVVSWMLPRDLRDHFRHVYSFCRWADDLGDEVGDPQRSLELLAWWRRELEGCFDGQPRHPVFVALHPTIQKHELPIKPFDDLIRAFEQDQRVTRYDTWDQVLDYCTRSADPVGRLVLYLCGYRDEARQRLSDFTCTALQLANFWQDVRRDILERDRVYLPRDVASAHGLDIQTMVLAVRQDGQRRENCRSCNVQRQPDGPGLRAIRPAFKAAMREAVERTWPLFTKGLELLPRVDRRVRGDIELFSRGGMAVLRAIERQDFDTLTQRPRIGKLKKAGLMLRVLMSRFIPGRVSARPVADS